MATHLACFVAGTVIAASAVGEARSNRFKTLDAFAHSLNLIQEKHVDSVGERSLVYAAINGMTNKLDEHSSFYSPKRYERLRQDTQGEFGGVGIALRKADKTANPPYPIVDQVVPGSPAARAHISAGDQLVAIDGVATATDGQVKRKARSFHSALRGIASSVVTVRVAKPAEKPRTVSLVRERIRVPSVEMQKIDQSVVYLRLRRFQDATTKELKSALSSANAKALVLDLRNNPGGLVDQAISVADVFLDHGTVVQVIGRKGTVLERPQASADSPHERIPVAVLIDQGTASAAEIVAAALKDQKRAVLFGTKSFGKGSVQTFFDLPDGSGLKLTTARYVSPAGQLIHGLGIQPNQEVEAFAPDVFVADGDRGQQPEDSIVSLRKKWPHLGQTMAEMLDSDFQLHEAYSWARSAGVK